MSIRRIIRLTVVVATLSAGLVASPATSAEPEVPGVNLALLALQRVATAPLSVVWAPELGAATAVRAPGGVLVADGEGDARERAMAFLTRFGAGLGVASPAALVDDGTVELDGSSHVRFTQTHRGVAVYGARITVHVAGPAIVAASGAFAPVPAALPVVPAITSAQAETIAAADAKGVPEGASLHVLHTGLLRRAPDGHTWLAWGVPVRTGDRRTLVFVDARTGGVRDRVQLTHHALDRLVTIPGDPEARKEGDPPHTLPSVNRLYAFTGQSYRLFRGAFGRDGFDGHGARMQANLVASMFCPNAWWDSQTTNYCPGLDVDDVVGHEWAHAYTEHTHDLIYGCQSGGLNESYSDIFGEALDLLNRRDGMGGSNNEEPWPNGQRWMIGEDISPSQGYVLGRDMWDPARVGSPGKLSDSSNCIEVHSGSGPPNHAFALLVDGGTYNGHTVDGIGLVKALHIYYRAMVAYQHPSTTMAEHQEALLASCDDLVGRPLRRPLTGELYPGRIGPADCTSVRAATDAVELGLWRRGLIIGRVTSVATGDPLSGQWVDVYTDGEYAIEFGETGPDGTYRIEGLDAGTYAVNFFGSTDYADQWYDGKASRETADPVVLAENGTAIGIDAQLQPRHRGNPAATLTGVTVERLEEGPDGLPVRDRISAIVENTGDGSTWVEIWVDVCPTAGFCTWSYSDTEEVGAATTATFDFTWIARTFAGTANIEVTMDWSDGRESAETFTTVVRPGPSAGVDHELVYEGVRRT